VGVGVSIDAVQPDPREKGQGGTSYHVGSDAGFRLGAS
jgi:hypothetical protein